MGTQPRRRHRSVAGAVACAGGVAEGEAELSGATPVAECVTPGLRPPLPDADDKDVEQGLYLAVTETVLKKIFPCEQDLPLLTHVREVDVHDTELADGDDDGWLAVVLANRLPVFDKASGKSVRYMACLVNVEGQLAVVAQAAAVPGECSSGRWRRTGACSRRPTCRAGLMCR